MSNYPPTPSFGQPFSFGGPPPMPPGRPPMHPMHSYGNMQTNRTHAPHRGAAYAQNVSYPPPNIQQRPPMHLSHNMPPPFPPHSQFSHGMNGHFPPPPYPPLPAPPPSQGPSPLPYAPAFQPPWPPPPLPLPATRTPAHNLPPTPTLAHPAPALTAPTLPAAPTATTAPTQPSRDREEGELSDGEMEDVSPTSTAVQQSNALNHHGIPSQEPSHVLPPPPRVSAHDPMHAPVAYQGHQEDGDRMSYSPPEQVADLAEKASRQYSPTLGKSVAEIRNLAKNAILNLHPFHISYSQIVAEGIHEDVVRDLFDELRLNYPSQAPAPTAQQPVPPKDPDPPPVINTVSKVASRTVTQQDMVADSPGTTPSATSPVHQVNGSTAAPASLPPKPAQTSAHKQVSVVNQPADTEITPPTKANVPLPTKIWALKPLNNGLSSHSSKPAGSGTPKMERKDLIAQKIAARAGKLNQRPAPGQVAGDNDGQPSLATVLNATVKSPGVLVAPGAAPSSHVPSLVPSLGPGELSTTPSATNSPPPPSLARKASATTELVRQRLAAVQQAALEKGGQPKTSFPPPVQAQGAASVVRPASTLDPVESMPPHAPAQSLALSTEPAAPGIPGLFMTPAAARTPDEKLHPPTATTEPVAPATLPRRKRPVAADFDAEPSFAPTLLKRPFGHRAVDQPLVIDISEEEMGLSLGDSDLDTDEDGDEARPGSALPRAGMAGHAGHAAIRDMPPLPDFPNKRRPLLKTFGSGTSSAAKNPPKVASSAPEKAAAQEHLKRKEEQINMMQRKIAELEQQRTAKQNGSRGATPPTAPATATGQRTPRTGPAMAPAASKAMESTEEIDRLIHDTHQQVERNQKELAQAKEAQRAAQTETQAIPVALEVATGADALTVSTDEMISATGRSPAPDPVSATPSKAEELRQKRAELEAFLLRSQAAVQLEQQRLDAIRREQEEREESMRQALAKNLQLAAELKALGCDAPDELVEAVETQAHQITILKESGVSRDLGRSGSAPDQIDTPSPSSSVHATSSAAAVAAVSGAVETEVTTLTDPVVAMVTPELAMDDGADEGEISEEHEVTAPVAPGVATFSDSDEAMDVEMPDDSSDASREASFLDDHPASHQPGDPPAFVIGESSSADSPMSHESDPYEPPEASPPNVTDLQSMPPHPRAAVASATPSLLQVPPSTTLALPTTPLPATLSEGTANSSITDKELAGPTPATSDALAATTSHDHDGPVPQGLYTPYESPLKQFRSFRYHPDFLQMVPGGYGSLTFSHQIDPHKPLCRYEASGGVCNDASCPDQHFRDMRLSDEMILVQIGSVIEGHTDAERAHFKLGLRHMLQGLGEQKVKDFTTVAAQIAAYRISCLSDRSRVLSLDGRARS